MKPSATAMFEGRDGLLFHVEFDDAAKFWKLAEYLRAHGLLRVERMQTKSNQVHGEGRGLRLSFIRLSSARQRLHAADTGCFEFRNRLER